jgi:hypothetical protein
LVLISGGDPLPLAKKKPCIQSLLRRCNAEVDSGCANFNNPTWLLQPTLLTNFLVPSCQKNIASLVTWPQAFPNLSRIFKPCHEKDYVTIERVTGRNQALSVDESRQVTNRECYSWMNITWRVLFVDEGGQIDLQKKHSVKVAKKCLHLNK